MKCNVRTYSAFEGRMEDANQKRTVVVPNYGLSPTGGILIAIWKKVFGRK